VLYKTASDHFRNVPGKGHHAVVTGLSAFFLALAFAVTSVPAQTFTTIYQFRPEVETDATDAFGGLIQSGSTLYGLTYSNDRRGGSFGGGTIYQFDLNSNTESVLHNFPNFLTLNPGDGKQPYGSLIQSGSTLYGMNSFGGTGSGAGGGGTIFQYSLATNSESVLYTFEDFPDGTTPYGSLLQSGSSLYGMTSEGGNNGGVLFQFNLNTSQETPLYTFNAISGESPAGSLILSGSTLYGMTSVGGANHDGTVFQYNLATNQESVLHAFGGTDGSTPFGSLTQSGSILYGLTEYGGIYNMGTLFQLNLITDQETVLHSFGAPGDGAIPTADLVLSGSMLYGSTNAGGDGRSGTVFQFDLNDDTESLLHQFAGDDDGGFLQPEQTGSTLQPEGDLLLTGSTLYGTTINTIFTINLPEPTSLMTLTLGAFLVMRRRRPI
jgi:uncharacterized repeat protein (TIGR03803 family)